MRFIPVRKAMKTANSALRCEKGATAIEYGLIVAFIFLAIVATIGQVADEVIAMWSKVAEAHRDI